LGVGRLVRELWGSAMDLPATPCYYVKSPILSFVGPMGNRESLFALGVDEG